MGDNYSLNWIWPPGSLTLTEKNEEWKGKGIFTTLNGKREFHLAQSREHWAALKRLAEGSSQKTGRGRHDKKNCGK